MASTYTPNLNLEKPSHGEKAGVWDSVVNANMDKIDVAVGGTGIQGATGLPGAQGTTGLLGIQGNTGIGAPGIQGDTGLPGIQGATGADGGGGGIAAPVDITAQCSIVNASTDYLNVQMQLNGKRVFLDVRAVWNTATGPILVNIPLAIVSLATGMEWVAPCRGQDLGTELTNPGLALVSNGNPYIELHKGWATADAFSLGPGGQSYVSFCINYPIA